MIVQQNALVLRSKFFKIQSSRREVQYFFHHKIEMWKNSILVCSFFHESNWVIPFLEWQLIITWQHLNSCSSAQEPTRLFWGPTALCFFKCLTHFELWCDLLLRISWLALGLESRGIGWFTAEKKQNNTHIWWKW